MISAPLAWFPRLLHASPEERNSWRFIGKGRGIHWGAIDEDISVEGLLAGRVPARARNRCGDGLKVALSGRGDR
ncbi:MAG: DUF2442 domain-containing protein [Nitrososphaera sp.]